MRTFIVIDSFDMIPDIRIMVSLISQQLDSYGADPDEDRILASLKNALCPGTRARMILIREENQDYSGFAFCNICSGLESGGDYLWINELFIAAAYRRKHIGTGLMRFIEEWAKKTGLVYIACSTAVKNETAQILYRSCGYEVAPTMWVDKTLR